jgi:VanZ family protein
MRALALLSNILLLVAIFYLGTIPAGPNVDALPGKDKLGHALAFGALAGTQLWGLWALGRGPRRLFPLFAALGSTLMGGVLELVQTQIPARSADILDWAADAAGALIVAVVMQLLLLRWRS